MKPDAVLIASRMRGNEYRRFMAVLGLLVLVAGASILLACSLGSVSLSTTEIFGAMLGSGEMKEESLTASVLELRMSRALAGFSVGAALALAGVMMQALLRNPLADPYILGVSGGASVGALISLAVFSVIWIIDAAAFGGALLIAFLLYALARRDFRHGRTEGGMTILLLTGVILSAGCSALVTLILSVAPDDRLRSMVFWLVGDLSGADVRWTPWVLLSAALVFGIFNARAVNLLALHADSAVALGIDIRSLRKKLFFCSAVLTASAVSTAGSIGFVGLIVPHACRFALGPDHRLLLPATALVGGSFIVLADTVARILIAPQQLPVGAITALIGVPVFLMQLHRVRNR